jgi:hypothetical protein
LSKFGVRTEDDAIGPLLSAEREEGRSKGPGLNDGSWWRNEVIRWEL